MASKSIARRRGDAAEALAVEFLASQGLALIARNLRCKAGELDLVCTDGAVLVFVEVRQRSRSDFGGALASVTWRKRRKLIRAARFWLRASPAWRSHRMRFDVVGVHGAPEAPDEVLWIRDAFRAT
jgi:putative endonuclease